ncbi:MAG: hypothetical protein U0X40_05125 [Ferruginibacter sp.]
MNRFVLFLLFLLSGGALSAQDFTGQWKGEFTDKSTSFATWGGNRCDYVLELDCKGSSITGYSYTYFNDGGKKYYTICRLKGTVNKANKSVEVTEVERTKTNVPNNIRNCFQIHRLSYFQEGDKQTLEGTWVPAPRQEGDCGYGSTVLSRRVLTADKSLYNKTATIPVKPAPKKEVAKNNPKPATAKTTLPQISNSSKANKAALAKNTPKTPAQPARKETQDPQKDVTKVQPPVKQADDQNADNAPQNRPDAASNKESGFEKRNSNLLKTIEIENDKFNVALYDNGEIDGDSISLFFNGKLLLSHKRLSDKPISLQLSVDEKKDVNELIMYAENLGSIPPNTALMIVTDGDKRYEARISSDLEKSGVIRFIHKPKTGQ